MTVTLNFGALKNDTPTCLYSSKSKLMLFDVSFYQGSPFLLAIGGKANEDQQTDPMDLIEIINTSQLNEIKLKFGLQ